MNIKKIIDESKDILIVSHNEADADTLGSQLGLYWSLKGYKGRGIKLYNYSKISQKYTFLPGSSKIKSEFRDDFDLCFVVDCGNLKRAKISKDQLENKIVINIDHHKSNTEFGTINIVDDSAVSTTLLIYEFLVSNKLPINSKCAYNLYAGMFEDSGGFVFDRVNQRALECAANLAKSGINPSKIAKELVLSNSLASWKMKSMFMESMELKLDAKIAFGYATKDMFDISGADLSIYKELALMLVSLKVVKVGVLFVEYDKYIKASFRSKDKDFDANLIAKGLGGGGHKHAASVRLDTVDINEAKSIIEDVLKEFYKQR